MFNTLAEVIRATNNIEIQVRDRHPDGRQLPVRLGEVDLTETALSLGGALYRKRLGDLGVEFVLINCGNRPAVSFNSATRDFFNEILFPKEVSKTPRPLVLACKTVERCLSGSPVVHAYNFRREVISSLQQAGFLTSLFGQMRTLFIPEKLVDNHLALWPDARWN